MTVLTESKMKSEAGSIMSCISSLTETTGFISPQSACGGGAEGGGGAGVGLDDEQADASAPASRSAMMTAGGRLKWRSTLILKEESPALVSHNRQPLVTVSG